jgi:hypothetical protein
MSPVTLYLGKLFGIGMLLMCVALAARPKAAIATITSMVGSPGLILVTGIVTMTAGLAAVLGHNLWSGGALPIAVTALAWLTLLKGLALVAAPPSALMAAYRGLHYPQRFGLVMWIGAAIGAAITWLAFTA